MDEVQRVLSPAGDLPGYASGGGGAGLEAAHRLGADGIIEHVTAAGLRGRGGAGFPTGRKWQTVRENEALDLPTTVVVNAAEGEPGSFKDRAILRANPYRVLEGALIAARAVGADAIVVALKASFETEIERVREAIERVGAEGWAGDVAITVFEGPSEYLYGEETALLEAIDGRPPLPRVAPPFRHGMDEIGEADSEGAADTVLSAPGEATVAPPTLVNNVETFANVPLILAQGPDWFRGVGTVESPGTVVCTVTGRTRRHGVAEVAMGTPLREVIDEVGGGPVPGRRFVGALSGVAHPILPEKLFDTGLDYESMDEAGAGLGAAGFIVYDDATDLVAVAHGVSRFLSVESCGQCTPCKQDGLALAGLLDRLRRSEASKLDVVAVADFSDTVADEARCFLAHQHQRVIQSLLRLFPEAIRAHADGGAPPADPELIAPIVDIERGRAVLDERHFDKQPDWTYEPVYSGQSPADQVE